MFEYVDWCASAASAKNVVVADSDGLILAQRGGTQLEAAMTIGFEQMLRQVTDILYDFDPKRRTLQGNVTIEHEGRLLITVWAPTAEGQFYTVLIGDSVPTLSVLRLVAAGLKVVFGE